MTTTGQGLRKIHGMMYLMDRRKNPFPGVAAITDRHGKRRFRFRMKGRPTCYIHGDYGSEQFRREYEAALASKNDFGNPDRMPDRGSFNWLIAHYLRTSDFQKIGKIYKRTLSGELERFRVEHGHRQIADLRTQHVEAIIARKSATPAAANKLLKLIRRLARFAIKRGWLDRDPSFGVKPYTTNPDGYHTWTDPEIAQFEAHHGISSKAVLALRIMLYTGAARQDAAALGWQNVKGKRIEYRRHKTGGSVSLRLALLPEVQEVLGGVPDDNLLFITTEYGTGYTPNSFGNWFRKQCKAAALDHCSAHGLRKAGATRLANAGATEFEIMAFLGHKTPDEARTYVKAANRQTLADSALMKRANMSNPVQRLDINRRKALKTKEK